MGGEKLVCMKGPGTILVERGREVRSILSGSKEVMEDCFTAEPRGLGKFVGRANTTCREGSLVRM